MYSIYIRLTALPVSFSTVFFFQVENDLIGQELQKQLEAAGKTFPGQLLNGAADPCSMPMLSNHCIDFSLVITVLVFRFLANAF